MSECESLAYDRFASFYDLMMGDRSDYIDFYSSLLTPETHSLIDLGCGSGVITAALANLLSATPHPIPLRIVGIDGSIGLLKEAAQLPVAIEWLHQDLRHLAVAGTFDLAICCYNTLQHVDRESLVQVFTHVRRLLCEGARFCFDLYQPNPEYLKFPQRNRMARRIARPAASDLEIRECTDFDEKSSLLTIRWKLIDVARPEDPPLATTVIRMWQHEIYLVENSLRKAGFRIQERYGDLARSLFSASSKKQVYLCTAV